MKKKPRVICAMSGGVDSSVAAALLKKQGYDVIGIFMKLWAEKTDRTDLVRENVCCSVDAATAARAVAQKLGIPFYVVNFAEDFKKYVVDYYVSEYENGRTPNPCVICNRDIKGELLMQKVLDLEGDYLATGHYARIKRLTVNRKPLTEKYHLLQGKDNNKDQTYFLWTLNQEKLSKLLFPVGNMTKADVRILAKKMGLPTAERRESQGICFIPDRDVAGFLRRYAKKLTKPGKILDTSGKSIGMHDGLINYTIGQRERLGLGGPKSYYVVELNSRDNSLIVGDDKDLYRQGLIVNNLNWVNGSTDQYDGKILGGRIRYGHGIEDCQIQMNTEEEIKVKFKKGQRAITPGQSIVFYKGDEVIGGGVIEKVL